MSHKCYKCNKLIKHRLGGKSICLDCAEDKYVDRWLQGTKEPQFNWSLLVALISFCTLNAIVLGLNAWALNVTGAILAGPFLWSK